MAKKKKAATRRTSKKTARKSTKKKAPGSDLLISKSRTKAIASMNVSGEFYAALDQAVRDLIATAEQRAGENNRRTLRPHDI